MARIVTDRTRVEEFFASAGPPVVDRFIPSYSSRYVVPVAQTHGARRHYYCLVEGEFGALEVQGRCSFRSVTLTATGDTYEEARLALRAAVDQYADTVLAAAKAI